MSAIISLFTGRQLLLGFIILLVALLDPFGLTSATEKASAQWLNRVFASKYPGSGQQRIAVILIDDDYLLRNKTYWPMPYGEQSKLFKRLLAYKPRAVFVDLLYSHDHSRGDPRQGSQLLANVFERYQRQGIPLMLANTGHVRGDDGQINVLPNFAAVSSPALVVWSGYGDKYPLAVKTSLGNMETPALALYREYCQVTACSDLPADAEEAAQAPPMAIKWGIKLAPDQAQVASIEHCPTSSGILETIKQLFQAIFWKVGASAPVRCPYNLTLLASDLETNDPEDRALLNDLLRDRLVLVGAHITSTGDLVQSPVHGKIPGIYLHAMALDNLISLDMDYDRDPASLFFDIDWLDLVEIALLGLIVILKSLHEHHLEERPALTTWPKLERGFFASPYWPFLLMIASLAILSFVLWSLDITPANVMAVALLSLALFSEKIELFFERKTEKPFTEQPKELRDV